MPPKKKDNKEKKSNLLPLNFHNSFKLERNYIRSLMNFAAGGGRGNIIEIRDATGIPSGEHSGKVLPTINYCIGMGLLTQDNKDGVRSFELTNFGRQVKQKDGVLMDPITQWIGHFNMCNILTGAAAWVHTFVDGYPAPLGFTFSREQLEEHLRIYFPKAKKLIGPLIGIYSEQNSLGICGVLLQEDSTSIVRKKPPLNDDMYAGYGAWLLQLIETFFPGKTQVTMTELQEATKWRNITGWSANEEGILLQELEKKSYLMVDRHMDPWLLTVIMPLSKAWQTVYADLI